MDRFLPFLYHKLFVLSNKSERYSMAVEDRKDLISALKWLGYEGAELEEALKAYDPIDFDKMFEGAVVPQWLRPKPAPKPKRPSIYKVMWDLDEPDS
jgi:Holliday junction resolvasome RuvABC DNA-binding subunit